MEEQQKIRLTLEIVKAFLPPKFMDVPVYSECVKKAGRKHLKSTWPGVSEFARVFWFLALGCHGF